MTRLESPRRCSAESPVRQLSVCIVACTSHQPSESAKPEGNLIGKWEEVPTTKDRTLVQFEFLEKWRTNGASLCYRLVTAVDRNQSPGNSCARQKIGLHDCQSGIYFRLTGPS